MDNCSHIWTTLQRIIGEMTRLVTAVDVYICMSLCTFTAVTRVRISLGTPNKKPPQGWLFVWHLREMQNSNRVRQRDFRGTSRWTRATAHFFAGALIHGFIVPSHVKRAVPRRFKSRDSRIALRRDLNNLAGGRQMRYLY